MKRFGAVLSTGLLMAVFSAGIAEAGPRQQREIQRLDAKAQQQLTPEQQQNRVQQLISDFYITKFHNTVGLTDDQFVKVAAFIRQFIQQRFRVANQRSALNLRRAQLLEQPDPPETDVRQLSQDTAQLDRTVGNMEGAFITKIQGELTPRQILMASAFNKRFFEEDLPKLIETARAEIAARGTNAAKNNRNNAQTPADAFRGARK